MDTEARKVPAPDRLLQELPPLPTAVVHPCDKSSLAGAVEAGRKWA
jgi:hypothetical protein